MKDESLLAVTRRHFFGECGVGVGKIALASLLAESLAGRAGGSAARLRAIRWPRRPPPLRSAQPKRE